MKTIKIENKDYTLEYSFKAAEHKQTVQKIFNVLSGAYLLRQTGIIDNTDSAENGKEIMANAMIDGASEMVADIPHIVKTAFYSGLLENQNVTEDEAYLIMKKYMKENKISFKKLFDDIKECMEDDGFFDLSGLTEMMEEMNKKTEETLKESATPSKNK